MRVLVCGGRDYHDREHVFDVLDTFHKENAIRTIIQGGCLTGADWWACQWAHHRMVQCLMFKANWLEEGKKAGPFRNKRMLEEGKPDLVIAFPGGRGTANMVALAQDAGVKVLFGG